MGGISILCSRHLQAPSLWVAPPMTTERIKRPRRRGIEGASVGRQGSKRACVVHRVHLLALLVVLIPLGVHRALHLVHALVSTRPHVVQVLRRGASRGGRTRGPRAKMERAPNRTCFTPKPPFTFFKVGTSSSRLIRSWRHASCRKQNRALRDRRNARQKREKHKGALLGYLDQWGQGVPHTQASATDSRSAGTAPRTAKCRGGCVGDEPLLPLLFPPCQLGQQQRRSPQAPLRRSAVIRHTPASRGGFAPALVLNLHHKKGTHARTKKGTHARTKMRTDRAH